MVTRSGAGGSMPPAVGVITDRVIAKRPDLEGIVSPMEVQASASSRNDCRRL